MPNSTARWFAGTAAVAAVLALGVCPAAAQASPEKAACSWTVRPLAPVAGYAQSYANGSDHGTHVFGGASNDNRLSEVPVVWSTDPNQPPRVLGLAHGASTKIVALNAAGVAVGNYRNDTGAYPVRFVGGKYEDLPVPAGANWAEAVDINAAGDIVGRAGHDIILWPGNNPSAYKLLPKPAGATDAWVNGIDDARNVIGGIAQGTGDDVKLSSYVWDSAGKATLLGGEPTSIRNGRIVGNADEMFAWNLSGKVLWHLGNRSHATAVNANGLVAGWKGIPDGLKSQLYRNGKVVADGPGGEGFTFGGSNSAVTDNDLIVGGSKDSAAIARCS